ncbi:MAG: ArsR/SmtB family transcription factor [Promethearchaeota archaeon]
MDDISVEEFFEIMGNEVRRNILQLLSRGPMSMRELTALLDVSRQAILKQLKAMEEKGLIVHEKEDSEESRKGPIPRVYQLRNFFTLTYEMNPSYVKPRIIQLGLLPGTRSKVTQEVEVEEEEINFNSCFDELVDIDTKLEKIIREHKQIYREKNMLIRRIIHKIDSMSSYGQEEKNVLYYMLKYPRKAVEGMKLEEISRFLNLRKDFAKAVMANLQKTGIVDLKRQEGGEYYSISQKP